jgi:hypothetical protein
LHPFIVRDYFSKSVNVSEIFHSSKSPLHFCCSTGLEMGKKKQNNSNNKNNGGSNNTKTPVTATNPITNYLKPTVREDQTPKNKETTLFKNFLSNDELQGESQKPSSSDREVKDNNHNNSNDEKEVDSQILIVSPGSHSSPSNKSNNRAIRTTFSEEDNLGLTLTTVSLSPPHSTSMKSPMVQFEIVYPESDELVRDVDCLVPNQTPIGLPRDGENDKSFHYHEIYNEKGSPYIARKNEGDLNDDDSLIAEHGKVRYLVSFFLSLFVCVFVCLCVCFFLSFFLSSFFLSSFLLFFI